MKIFKTDFSVEMTQPEAEQLTMKYFLHNRFYNRKSETGLEFRRLPQGYGVLSPKVSEPTVNVLVQEAGDGCRVYGQLKIYSGISQQTRIAEAYHSAFLEHFKTALQRREISLYTGDEFVRESRRFTKTYLMATALAAMAGITLATFFDLHFLVAGMVALAPTIGVGLVNYLWSGKAATT